MPKIDARTTTEELSALMLNTRHHLIQKNRFSADEGGIAGPVINKTEKLFGGKIHVIDEEEALMEILTPM